MAVPIYRCKRCGHEWAGRRDRPAPKTCAKCRSPYWDRERTRGIKPSGP